MEGLPPSPRTRAQRRFSLPGLAEAARNRSRPVRLTPGLPALPNPWTENRQECRKPFRLRRACSVPGSESLPTPCKEISFRCDVGSWVSQVVPWLRPKFMCSRSLPHSTCSLSVWATDGRAGPHCSDGRPGGSGLGGRELTTFHCIDNLPGHLGKSLANLRRGKRLEA